MQEGTATKSSARGAVSFSGVNGSHDKSEEGSEYFEGGGNASPRRWSSRKASFSATRSASEGGPAPATGVVILGAEDDGPEAISVPSVSGGPNIFKQPFRTGRRLSAAPSSQGRLPTHTEGRKYSVATSFTAFDEQMDVALGIDVDTHAKLKALRQHRDAEANILRLGRENAKLRDEATAHKKAMADVEEELAIFKAVCASARAREDVAKKAESTAASVSATVLASQLERLAAVNTSLRSQLAAERTQHEDRFQQQKEQHEQFLLSIAGEFASLQGHYEEAVARNRVLETQLSETNTKHTTALAQLQKNSVRFLDRQYVRPGVLNVAADRSMYGNTLHDKSSSSASLNRTNTTPQKQLQRSASAARSTTGSAACVPMAPRPPSAASLNISTPVHASTRPKSAELHAQRIILESSSPSADFHHFSRLPPSHAYSPSDSSTPIVFPRHTMTELLRRHAMEVERLSSPRTAR